MSDNETAVVIIAIIAVTVITIIRAIAGSRRQRAKESVGGENLENRLARVEVALDDVTAELGRMTESHQFLLKALTERVSSSVGSS